MNASVLRGLIRNEIRRIPRGDYAQNELRMVYAIVRQHDLARRPAASGTVALAQALRSVHARHPDFVAAYDCTYFGVDLTATIQNDSEGA
jgi:hypothetical protein